jgi:hypothetical protein
MLHGRIGLAIFFDISGFFDSLDPDQCTHTLRHLGVDEHTVRWIHALMTSRCVQLKWGQHSAEPKDIMRGTPQGSPLSPLLSALYTSPLLTRAANWVDGNLSLYVDDGCIFVSRPMFRSVAMKAAQYLKDTVIALRELGLDVDETKYNAMFFYRARLSKHCGTPVMCIPETDVSPLIKVAHTTVRYLGLYFDKHLSWTHHCTVMSNRVRSSVRALRVAGNSIRGLSYETWRRVWTSTISPTLFYGVEAWYHPRLHKAIHILQTGQDEFC